MTPSEKKTRDKIATDLIAKVRALGMEIVARPAGGDRMDLLFGDKRQATVVPVYQSTWAGQAGIKAWTIEVHTVTDSRSYAAVMRAMSYKPTSLDSAAKRIVARVVCESNTEDRFDEEQRQKAAQEAAFERIGLRLPALRSINADVKVDAELTVFMRGRVDIRVSGESAVEVERALCDVAKRILTAFAS